MAECAYPCKAIVVISLCPTFGVRFNMLVFGGALTKNAVILGEGRWVRVRTEYRSVEACIRKKQLI